MISRLKSAIVPRGSRPRRVRFGLYRSLILDLDLSNSTQLYLGLWERETYRYIRRGAARCQWAMDIGAGRGELSIYLAKCANIEQVYAFEPNLSEREIFLINMRRNLSNGSLIKLIDVFVGTERAGHQVTLDSVPVDRGKRGFMRIDVDGSEHDVLESGRQLLASARVDLIVETHSEASGG